MNPEIAKMMLSFQKWWKEVEQEMLAEDSRWYWCERAFMEGWARGSAEAEITIEEWLDES